MSKPDNRALLRALLEDQQLTSSESNILKALFLRADSRGRLFMNQDELMTFTGLKQTAITQNTKLLAERGVIEVRRRNFGSDRKMSEYVIQFPSPAKRGSDVPESRLASSRVPANGAIRTRSKNPKRKIKNPTHAKRRSGNICGKHDDPSEGVLSGCIKCTKIEGAL